MNCSNCQHELEPQATFCGNCGHAVTPIVQVPSVETQPAIEKKPSFFKTFFAKRNNLFSAIGVLVLVIASLVVLSPKTVTVDIRISSNTGGVFTQDCQLTTYAEEFLNNELSAQGKSESKPIIGKIDWILDNGKCSGVATVSVSAFETYDLYVGDTMVGSIKSGEAWGGEDRAEADIDITHDLTVTFNLVDTSDYCTGTLENWTCWGLDNLDTDSDAGTCEGTWGYRDLQAGTSITVTGKSNGKTYSGILAIGNNWTLDSISSGKVTCTMLSSSPIQIDHDDEGYNVEVGSRGQVYFDIETLESDSWDAGIHLGD